MSQLEKDNKALRQQLQDAKAYCEKVDAENTQLKRALAASTQALKVQRGEAFSGRGGGEEGGEPGRRSEATTEAG